MAVTKSGKTLAEVIHKAIDDSVITNAEYEEILALASQDAIIDRHEKILLAELNNMLADQTIKRVR